MKTIISALLIVVVFSSGCANLGDVIRAKESGEEGTTQVYPINADQAWKIAITVFRWEDTDAIEEHRDEGFMLTSSGTDAFSWGAVMGAWVKPLGENKTEVTVVTKRKLSTTIRISLTEGTFHRRFAQAVEIIKAGKPLPRIAPIEN